MLCLVSGEMNTRVRTTLQTMKTPLRHEKEKRGKTETWGHSTMESKQQINRRSSVRERKMALKQDVDKLKKKLRQEENVHRALERAFTRPLGALPRLPPYLPPHTLALLAEVAVLEEEIVRLEELIVTFRQGLYQEAVHISSSKKNLENAIGSSDHNASRDIKIEQSKTSCEGINETLMSSPLPSVIDDSSGSAQLATDVGPNRTGHCSTRPMNRKKLPSKHLSHLSLSEDGPGKENKSTKSSNWATQQKATKIRTYMRRTPIGREPIKKFADALQLQQESQVEQGRTGERSSATTCRNTLEREIDDPNEISEDLLKCLSSIFMRMSTPKAMGMELETSSSASEPSPRESSIEEDFLDPYGIFSEFERRDIGPYKHVDVIVASSVDPKRVTNSAFLIQRMKLLLEKLSVVDLLGLSHQQKLAFWINVYNSCMMNAFLEHGIPRNPETLVALMQKAMINVGGHLLNAMMIEHFILRLPYHSKCGFAKCLKNDELMERNIFGLDWPEPLVTFALSCGSWSSPSVRVYTASQVEAELQAAKRDYLQAAVGISATKAAIPKLLDWYLLDFEKDIESLLDWVCLQLPNGQRNEAIKCLARGRNGTALQSVTVSPYDFSFRYLLAP